MRTIITGLLICTVAAWLAVPVWAMNPTSGTAMGVPAQAGDNEIPNYVPPLGGCYYLQEPAFASTDASGVQCVWAVYQVAPNNAKDPGMTGQAMVIPLVSNGKPGQWAKLLGQQAGWVKVRCTWPIAPFPFTEAYYRFYDIVTIEDDVGATGRVGFDPRYASQETTWFTERGGYHFGQGESEPGAEDILGYNDRFPSGTLIDKEWTGDAEDRTPIWMPETQLLPDSTTPAQGTPQNSLLSNTRDNQMVRVWLHGPRERGLPVPIHLHCTSNGAGEVHPGKPVGGGNSYDIKIITNGGFDPPEVSPTLPGLGDWFWPDNYPIRGPEVRIIRDVPEASTQHSVDDPPVTGRQRNWILRVPWTGKLIENGENEPPTRKLSGIYGDIEVEARIPPEGCPFGLAQQYGDDPNGEWEGNMQVRLGTVIELHRIEVRTAEPDDEQFELLKDHWYRRVRYKTRNLEVPATMLTLAFGAIVRDGTDFANRSEENASLQLQLNFQDDEVDPDKPLAEPYFTEVTLTGANLKVEPDLEVTPWANSLLTAADVPADILEPWFDGEDAIRPPSLLLDYRGYVGAIPRNPSAEDFDTEVAEFEDVPSEPETTRQVAVHFINVLADVDNDGQLTAADDTDEMEESEPGLIVNRMLMDAASDDVNPRELRIRLSEPPSGHDYSDCEVWIQALAWGDESPKILLTENQDGSDPLTYLPEQHVYRLPLPPNGMNGNDPVSVWLREPSDCDREQSAFRFFLVREEEEDETVVLRRHAMDEISITFHPFGIDVDSQNDGDIDEADDQVEEAEPGRVVVLAPAGTPTGDVGLATLLVRMLEDTSGMDQPKVFLWKSYSTESGGALAVQRTTGETVLDADDGPDDRYEVPLSEITSGNVTLKLRGTRVGAVTLTAVVEVGPSEDRQVIALDVLRVSIATGNLTIYNGLAGRTGGQQIAEADEQSVGAVTVANLNDTDGNDVVDYLAASSGVSGEVDLHRVVVSQPAPGDEMFAEVRFSITSAEGVWIYEDADKNEDSWLGGQPTLDMDDFTEAGNTKTLWFEARGSSNSVRDTLIRYEARLVNTQTWVELDRVKATAIWVSLENAYLEGSALPSDLGSPARDFVLGMEDPDGDLFGVGLYENPLNEGNNFLGGRILLEWRISPSGADSLPGVAFDVTRQAEWESPNLVQGQAAWDELNAEGSHPNLGHWPSGDETPNDDNLTDDEDNTPSNRRLYSADGPGIAETLAGSIAFACQKMSCREFVRIRLDGEDFANDNGLVEGSRVSFKVPWHVLTYTRCTGVGIGEDNGLDQFSFDESGTNAAASDPIGFGTDDGGTMEVTSLNLGASTEGFTATFNSSARQWTLTGTSEETDTADEASQHWLLELPGRCDAEAVETGTFGTGDFFNFSVFKSTRSGGKKNEIGLYEVNVSGGP